MQQPVPTPLRPSEASVSPGIAEFVKVATAFGIGHSVILAGIASAALWLWSWLSARTPSSWRTEPQPDGRAACSVKIPRERASVRPHP